MSARLPGIAILCSVIALSSIQGTEMDEYRVKALFLYNFAQFVDWPASSFASDSAPITYCLLGSDGLDGELEKAVANKIVKGHPLVVRHISEIKQSSNCQIVFIGDAQSKRIRAILSEARPGGLLIVGAMDRFAANGGTVNFKLKDGNLKLEINVSAAEREGLRISSKLLSLAEIVK